GPPVRRALFQQNVVILRKRVDADQGAKGGDELLGLRADEEQILVIPSARGIAPALGLDGDALERVAVKLHRDRLHVVAAVIDDLELEAAAARDQQLELVRSEE